MSITSSTSTSPVIMPDTTRYIIPNSVWYTIGMKVNVHWDPEIVKRMKNKNKINLYENRSFEIFCRIDKKITTRPTITSLLNDLIIISVDGHEVNFRRPRLDPPPAGASTNTSKDKAVAGYDWKYHSFDWVYDFDNNLYRTSATITGAWSKFCYRGTRTYTYYSTT